MAGTGVMNEDGKSYKTKHKAGNAHNANINKDALLEHEFSPSRLGSQRTAHCTNDEVACDFKGRVNSKKSNLYWPLSISFFETTLENSE